MIQHKKFNVTSLLHKVREGGWAVLDHGIFTGTNYFLNILLARWISADDFGAYSVAYSILYLLITLQTAVIFEPMQVFGSKKYQNEFLGYFKGISILQFILSIILSLLIAVIAILLKVNGSIIVYDVLICLAIASPFMLNVLLLRRAFFVLKKPEGAVLISITYSLLSVVLIFQTHKLSHFSAYIQIIVLGLVSLLISIGTLVYFCKNKRLNLEKNDNVSLKSIITEHYNYGLPSMGGAFARWSQDNVLQLLLPIFGGLQLNAAFKTLFTLVYPFRQLLSGLSNTIIPDLSRKKTANKEDRLHFKKIIRLYTLNMLGLGIIYSLALLIFGKEIYNFLYGSQYSSYFNMITLITLFPILFSLIILIGSALKAMERPDKLFLTYLISLFVLIFVGVPLIIKYSLMGAVISYLISVITTCLLLIYFYNKMMKTASKHS